MKTVEWYEHPLILEINDYVDNIPDMKCVNGYYDIGGVHFTDFKDQVERWVLDRKETFDKLLEMVAELPDDEAEEYDLDE